MTDLRRMLWRFNSGLLDAHKLRESFLEEILVIVSAYRREEADPVDVNSPEFQLCKVFDESIDSSQKYARSAEFNTALEHLRKANTALERLKLTSAARQRIAGARRSCAELFQMADSISPDSLATFAAISRLIAKSEELFHSGEIRQARFVAAMSSHEIDNLLAVREDSSGVLASLNSKISEMSRLADDLSRIPWHAEMVSISPFLAQIEALIAARRLVLAERLLDDFELLMAPAVGFVAELFRQLGPPALTETSAITSLLAERAIDIDDSWESATDRLLEGAFTGTNLKIRQIHEMAVSAAKSNANALATAASNAS